MLGSKATSQNWYTVFILTMIILCYDLCHESAGLKPDI